MEGDGGIEVLLLQTCLHSDGGRLENLRSFGPDHVDSNNTLGLAIENKLVEGTLIATG